MEVLSKAKHFGGELTRAKHASSSTNTAMEFAVYMPPGVEAPKVLYWLSGLTCTDKNFSEKAGAFRTAAELGLAIVMPDTSPRGAGCPGEDDSYDFGSGAGFYLTATEKPWDGFYNMHDYVTKELPALVEAEFKVAAGAANRAVFGHSMGGHGALVLALKNPGHYKGASAFAPICNPCECPWGQKAFSGYLGDNKESWKAWDATELVKGYSGPPLDILITQGGADNFYTQKQLLPENFAAAAEGNSAVKLAWRVDDGYDHSYWYIATFVEEHIRHLNKTLSA